MDPIGIQLSNLRPVARREAATWPEFPWGDGIPANHTIIEAGGPNDPYPLNPGRSPRKWPDAFDSRSIGFMPWSRRTATPSPAAYEFTLAEQSDYDPWPFANDVGSKVRLVPDRTPSEPSLVAEWNGTFDSGSTIRVVTHLAGDDLSGVSVPRDSLVVRVYVDFAAGGPTGTWATKHAIWTTSRTYTGANEFFGPLTNGPLLPPCGLAHPWFDGVYAIKYDLEGLTGCLSDFNGTWIVPGECSTPGNLSRFSHIAENFEDVCGRTNVTFFQYRVDRDDVAGDWTWQINFGFITNPTISAPRVFGFANNVAKPPQHNDPIPLTNFEPGNQTAFDPLRSSFTATVLDEESE